MHSVSDVLLSVPALVLWLGPAAVLVGGAGVLAGRWIVRSLRTAPQPTGATLESSAR